VFTLLLGLAANVTSAQETTNVRWLPPPDPDVAGYVVYVGQQSASFTSSRDIGFVAPDASGVASFDISDLVATRPAYVVMTAYDGGRNESVFSNEIVLAAAAPAPTPTPVPAPECVEDLDCDDGEPCNGSEECIAGSCASGAAPVCPSGSVCRIARCEPGVGCVQDPLPEGTSCADELRCNGEEVCSAGACAAPAVLDCAVSGPCATGLCDEALGCVVERHPDGSVCDDGDPATENDVCQLGTCAGEAPPEPGDDCARMFGEPHAQRLTLTGPMDAPLPTVLWDAPLAAPAPGLVYRPVDKSDWTEVAGTLVGSDGCEGHYQVALGRLDPLLHYEYRVSGAGEGGAVWTDSASFAASAQAGGARRFHVAFFASNGLDGASLSPRAQSVLDAIGRLKPAPVAILGGGDYSHPADAISSGVASDERDAAERWLEQVSSEAAGAPFLPVYGDRDAAAGVDTYTALRHPTLDSQGGGNYAFDYGSVHFLALNAPTLDALDPATDAGREKLAFVEEDLSAARNAEADFIVVYLHADLFSSEQGFAVDERVRDNLAALFERYGVNVVLSGDGASFERSYPMRDGALHVTKRKWVPRSSGVVYLRAGAGGRTDFGRWQDAQPPEWSAARGTGLHPFVLLRAQRSRGSLTVATIAVDTDGDLRVIDHFALY
jgi:hypothetical protein